MRGLNVQPITLKEAMVFVTRHHRHHGAPRGGLFAIAAASEDAVRAVVIVGRPVARALQDGYTAEVTRLCALDAPNACSMLYAAAWRAARAMGYRRLITYILESERGTTLQAAGWRLVHARTGGGSWSCRSRPRVDTHPIEQKQLWEAAS